MHELADELPRRLVAVDSELELEFERRVVESSTLAFRIAYGVLRRREDAEDVAQDAFAKAYRSFRQLRDRDRFRAWLVRMTWRLALDRQRSDRRRATRETIHATEAPTMTTTDHVIEHERAQRLWEGDRRLPEKLRVVVVLAGIEEHDLNEVARLLDVPLGTVKSRMFTARARMREQLQCTMNSQQR